MMLRTVFGCFTGQDLQAESLNACTHLNAGTAGTHSPTTPTPGPGDALTPAKARQSRCGNMERAGPFHFDMFQSNGSGLRSQRTLETMSDCMIAVCNSSQCQALKNMNCDAVCISSVSAWDTAALQTFSNPAHLSGPSLPEREDPATLPEGNVAAPQDVNCSDEHERDDASDLMEWGDWADESWRTEFETHVSVFSCDSRTTQSVMMMNGQQSLTRIPRRTTPGNAFS